LALPNYSQTVDELMYSQSVWGFQPLKATDLDHLSSQTQCDYGGRIYLFRKVWMRVVALSCSEGMVGIPCCIDEGEEETLPPPLPFW